MAVSWLKMQNYIKVYFIVFITTVVFWQGAQQLRLANSWSRCAGRVEVFHGGAWGTVCDDNFDMDNARVVCRQLGCGEPTTVYGWSYFGHGSGEILLNNVNCTGSESYLWSCPHDGWFVHDCGHNEDVSVVCTGNVYFQMWQGFCSYKHINQGHEVSSRMPVEKAAIESIINFMHSSDRAGGLGEYQKVE